MIFLLLDENTRLSSKTSQKETPIPEKQITKPRSHSIQTSEQDRLKNFQASEFYKTITHNNLFRPLGWRPPRPIEPYRLIGTIIFTDDKIKTQAIIKKK